MNVVVPPPDSAGSGPRVLGVDPGSRHTGWALVVRRSGRFQLEAAGVIHTDPEAEMASRLAHILRELRAVALAQRATAASVEAIFSHRSAQSALVLGQARGVALAALADAGLPVHEYNASVIKQSVAGSGNADKAQVGRMVQMLLGETAQSPFLSSEHARDACAIAMTHHLHAGRVLALGAAKRPRKLDPRSPAAWGVTLPAAKLPARKVPV